MKKTIKNVFIFMMLFIITSYSYASNSSLLNQLRASDIYDYKNNLDSIASKIESYIFDSSDLTPTKEELLVFYNLPSSFFKNFNNGSLDFTFDSISKKIIITNTLGVLDNSYIIESYLSNSSNNKIYSSNNNYDVSYYIDVNTSTLVDFISKINTNPNIVISSSSPIDTSKTWYEPNGNGIFKIYSFYDSIWNYIGLSNILNNEPIQVDSLPNLNSISCLLNDKAFIIENFEAKSYICTSNNVWVEINTGSSSSLFNGDATILQMLTTLKNNKTGSIVTAMDPFSTGNKHIYNGVNNFTKKITTSNESFWENENHNIIGSFSLDFILNSSYLDGTFAYLVNPLETNVILLEKINGEWFIIADGYNDVVKQEITSLKVLDKKNNQYFKFINNYWVDITSSGNSIESTFLTNHSSGRDVFPSPKVNSKYLTLDNDCSELTCNAPITLDFFAGEQIDSMFAYYYSTSGNRKNNLIDATPSISITDTYNRELYLGLVNNTDLYIKDQDTLNRDCYKDISNNNYYTKIGIKIPTGKNLPNSKTCETATYSGDSLILDTRTEATDWITAPNNTKVYLTVNSTIYTHIKDTIVDFWTTNSSGDGQINATEIFTGGDRTKFPMVTKEIVALTKLVDLPNYSTTGIVSTIDTSFKGWKYDNLDPKRVNNLVDKLLPIFPTGTLKCVGETAKSIIKYSGGIEVYVAEGVADIQNEIFVNKRNPLHICTSNVVIMANLFNGNTTPYKLEKKDFNLDISNWDTSKVIIISNMFSYATNFNQPIGSWNTSNVQNMNGMFNGATLFNQPIGSWNVSNVQNMQQMFQNALAFNQPIGSWNVSNVTNMTAMFAGAKNFNQPIGSWNVSNVQEMSSMFNDASTFNQPIGSWNTSKVTNMSVMFNGASTFNQPIDSWNNNVSNVTTMFQMFYNATNFNQPIGSWNVSNVQNMYQMFYNATLFNQPIGSWNVSKVQDMYQMFYNAKNFNQPIGSWNVSKVTNMFQMFYNATLFNQPIGSWNTSNVYNMTAMFQNALAFNQPIGSWNVSNVTNINGMFYNATNFNQPIGSWNVSKVTNMFQMFYNATNFNQPIGSWNVSNVQNMQQMFQNALAFNQPIGSWNVSNVTNINGMFYNATLFNQPIGSWNTSNVRDMTAMFQNATNFNQDISHWFTTSLSVSPPSNFDTGTTAWVKTGRQPIW